MLSLLIALLSGLAVGLLDVGASEVQGTVLLLMVAAFLIAMRSRSPAWAVAAAVAVGMPVGHIVSRLASGAGIEVASPSVDVIRV